VLERSSNSQNVKTTVIRITTRGTSGNSFKLELSDGSFFCVSANFLLEERIVKNFECDNLFIERLEEEEHYLFCRQKGYELVGMREHSSQELYIKLLKKGFAKMDIETLLSELRERNLLDDRRFALKRVAARIRRSPSGRSFLVADLQSKGVARDIAVWAVAEAVSDEQIEEALQKAIEKLSRRSSRSRQSFIDALLRKGFSWGDIKRKLGEE